ncbi:MAG: mycofactocin-coupled SDR family oxidoreductase [Endomicrobium sp.]|jgi:NAD(P)-dependent dehydrogenase (short-subunit alcohol dehydrogenase family)|nr:mycofactocin-coupled SDR family oxidoreductase [Endomicrobium sp.]
MGEFNNKTVFITGAAKGQGRAVALAFAKEGADIAAFDLGEKISYPSYNRASGKDLDDLKKEIESLGVKCAVFAGDVRNFKDVENAVSGAVKEFGKIDILFNNAGVAAYGYSWELTQEEWSAVIDINLTGAWLVGKYVIPQMIKQNYGVIINNSSVGGLRGFNRLSHYCASKWGMTGLTKSWAIELVKYNIRVLSIHPTGVNTPFNDGLAELEGKTREEVAQASAGNLQPVAWIEPEDVANSVLFLASDKAGRVTGSQFVLDAGLLTK